MAACTHRSHRPVRPDRLNHVGPANVAWVDENLASVTIYGPAAKELSRKLINREGQHISCATADINFAENDPKRYRCWFTITPQGEMANPH